MRAYAYFATASAGAEGEPAEEETAVNGGGALGSPALRNINPPPSSMSSPATAAQSPSRPRRGLAGGSSRLRAGGVWGMLFTQS
ncbi:MAG: hypothetical protein RBS80_31520 [Thermoguttaceae bacterium]|nr:hypothetical protein [Thermoguttaceae bacterium]